MGHLKEKNKINLSLLIHPREIQSKSSITALHTAQTSIIAFAQIPSQIHGEVIKKKEMKKKIIHICEVTSNKSATEQLFQREKGCIKEEGPQHTHFTKPNQRTVKQRWFSFKHQKQGYFKN